MRYKQLIGTVFISIGVVAGGYYGYKLGDRTKPYDRIYGMVKPVAPEECVDETGKHFPPGPVPTVIRASGGDCIRQEWTVDRHKVCNVVPSNPYVYRWIIDENGVTTRLPVIPSQQVNGVVPRMSKTFIHPKISTPKQEEAWISYRARVDVACPLDAWPFRNTINPVHLIWPLHMDELSTEYRVVP